MLSLVSIQSSAVLSVINDYDENHYSLSGYRVNNLPCSRYFDCDAATQNRINL